MLTTVFVLSLVLWLLGVATASTFGGFIHLLLLVALVTAGIRIVQGRKMASKKRS
jgi:hypothetical protein